MDIYWYWPFAHERELPHAVALLREGDRLTVQSFATRFGQRITSEQFRYEVIRDLPEPGNVQGNPVAWLSNRAYVYLSRSKRRASIINRKEFELVHIHALNYFTDWAALSRPSSRTKAIYSVHDVLPHVRRVPRPLERGLLGRIYRQADALVVAHPVLRDMLLDFGVNPDRVAIVPLPLRPVHSPPDPANRPDPPLVLFFGTFRSNKGIPLLLDAIASLSGIAAVRFHFAGRGEPELERLVARAAASSGHITAEIGYISRERKDELYREASLVVLPYTSFASQSGILADAYRYRVPVVVSDVGALGPTVRDEGTGWVTEPRDSEALGETIAAALTSRESRLRCSERQVSITAARHPQAIGKSLRRLYEDVLSGAVQ